MTMRSWILHAALLVGAFFAALMVAGPIVFWIFRVSGNIDDDGAEIGLYPGAIALMLAAGATSVLYRWLRQRSRSDLR